MRFSWKIFFCTLLLVCLTFSVGGYWMISAAFRSGMEKEINLAREENKLLRFSFENAGGSGVAAGGSLSRSFVRRLAQSLEEGAGGGSRIRVSGQDQKPLYASPGIRDEISLPEGIDDQTRGYLVIENEGRYNLQMASRTAVGSSPVYLETFRDITGLHEDRRNLYWIYVRLLAALVVLNGIATFLAAFWLTRPISSLARTARRIAAGDLEVRAEIRSEDEIGRLAGDFNQMADHVQEHMEALRDNLKRQEAFIASFAHELKTPLTSIIGYADMLRLKNLSPDQHFLAADYIFQEGRRLEQLSFKLLDLIVLKRRSAALRPVQAGELFEAMRQSLLPLTAEGGIRFAQTWEEGVVLAEPDLLKTVLLNLIDNARKALENGKGRIRMTGVRCPGGYQITVEDNGKGIPKEDIPLLTEAFFVVDKSRARSQGGAGLGLAICAEIVRLHGGGISFDSTPGEGTAVTLTLKEGKA